MLYNTFKTCAPEQCAKFFNANDCILEFIIKWMTISMIIAQGAIKEMVVLPTAFREYMDIFSEKTPIKLLLFWSYNCTIKLKDLFIPKQAKAYPLNPIKHQACKEFIEKHFKTSRISPSKSPQVAPFFFIKKKKAGKLCSCQDYWYLNSHMIKNIYPLPLISDLIDKLQGSSIFTKVNIWWGYNNVFSKPEDCWKTAFTTPLGLFKPNIVFFGMCNSPAMFQAFMDFHPSTCLTIPTAMGHDHEWQRDLCGDLGAVHRWRYSEHHLLRLSPTASLFSQFYFHFGLIYILVSIIMPYIAFLSLCLCPCISMITPFSPT